MRVDDLCARLEALAFPTAEGAEPPERDAVQSARVAVAEAVDDDEFLLDCLARELERVAQGVPRWGLSPFHTLDSLGVRFALGYWRPMSRAGAHEHTAWTITAVCRNELRVQTYDRDASYREGRLVEKNLFDAPAGRAGFIYEPSLHNPGNPTGRWSLSLHLSSPHDGRPAGDYDVACLPSLIDRRTRRRPAPDDPYRRVLETRQRDVVVGQIAGHVLSMRDHGADVLLGRCAELGPSRLGRLVARRGPASPGPGKGGHGSVLVRTDDRLDLTCRDVDGGVTLGSETSHGWVEELTMAAPARAALRACARERTLRVAELPGPLDAGERRAIAEALEETGLYRIRVGT